MPVKYVFVTGGVVSVAVSFETAIFCSPESDILAMMENIEYPWSRTAKSDCKISDAVH